MVIRPAYRFGKREGIDELCRLVADRCKEAAGERIGLDHWLAYHTHKSCMLYDPVSVADPLETRLIDPNDVHRRPKYGCFDRITNIGNVRGGDWDQSELSFTDHPTYVGLVERFDEGLPWEDTVYVEHNAKRIQNETAEKGCSTIDDLLEVRCPYIDHLFDRIKRDGYKAQAELGASGIDDNRHDPTSDWLRTNEVGVNISRDGSFQINSGFHRLSIARILGIDEIPVQVIVRHREWQKIREETATTSSRDALPLWIHRHIPHPDLVDIDFDCNRLGSVEPIPQINA